MVTRYQERTSQCQKFPDVGNVQASSVLTRYVQIKVFEADRFCFSGPLEVLQSHDTMRMKFGARLSMYVGVFKCTAG